MRAQEFITESIDADQVLDYVNRLHHNFDIEYSITDHPEWELKNIPLSQLKLDPDGEEQDPYNRVNWVDYDTVRDLMPKIGSVLKSSPIVVDSQGWIIDGNHRAAAAVEAGLTSVPALVPVKQNIAEGVNDYLWHGSKTKHSVLYPQQANDTGGKKESNKNAVYATPSARVAIAMGLTTPGSDTGMFPNDPQMVLFKGGIRKGQMVYLHKVPKNLFIKHNDREWYSKPGVKEVKPLEVVTVPVDKWLHLIRQATPQDLELQKKNLKKQGVAESRIINPERVDVYYRPVPGSRGRRVVAKNIPVTALEPLLKKLSEKYAVPVASFEWTDAQGVKENIPQPGKSSGKAKQFNPNAKVQTKEMTLDQILSTVKGIPYVNNVVDDWDAKDYSWGVTKKVIEYAQYLQKNPQSVANLPPLVVIDGQLNDGAHRLSAINLLQKRMDSKNPLWKQVKLKVNFGTSADVAPEQGVAENMDHSRDDRAVEELRAALLAKKDQLQSATDDQVYDIIDKIMTRIARSHSISGQKLHDMWVDRYKQIPDTWVMNENFADGKGPGRPGDSVRHGIPKKATMAELEKASHAKGRKGQLARWQLNMRRGRKKTNEVTVGVLNLGEFAINVDDHAFERAQQRKINLADIDTVLRKIKLPRVIKKIMDIDVGNRFYVLDHVTDVALGFRRIGDKKLVLKTVYSGRPMDLNIAGIITV